MKDNDTDNDTDNDIDRRINKVLLAIKNNSEISIANLAKLNNVSKSTTLRYIKILKNKGFLERVGKEKSGYWKIL